MEWFIFGLLTGVGGLLLIQAIKSGRLKVKVWHWIIAAVWYLAIAFTIGIVSVSVEEGASLAAFMFALFFGVPIIVLTVLLYRFVIMKKREPIA